MVNATTTSWGSSLSVGIVKCHWLNSVPNVSFFMNFILPNATFFYHSKWVGFSPFFLKSKTTGFQLDKSQVLFGTQAELPNTLKVTFPASGVGENT